MKHDIRHDLPLDLAQKVARKAVTAYEQRFSDYDFNHRWHDDSHVELSFAVAGKRLDGSLEVHGDRLTFSLDVPFVFRVFRGKAIRIIEQETQAWIERGKKGEVA